MTPNHSLRSGSGQAGTLYVVATPIGNLEDITLRALRVLRDVDVIACEDTRHTRLLLSRHGIRTPLISYHEHNESPRAAELISRLEAGGSVALVSDAGMPLLSDPGYTVVREAVAHAIAVVAVPGPSAITAALAVAGLPADRFLFVGFLPRGRAERRRALSDLAALRYTLIFFEAPHRVGAMLADLTEVLGNRRIAVIRELTKRFEEILRGPAADLIEQLRDRPPRGEFTIVVEGAAEGEERAAEETALRAHLATLLHGGVTSSAAARIVAAAHRVPRRTVYQLALQLREQGAAGGAKPHTRNREQ